MKKTFFTITVGIPAWNEQNSIGTLLMDLTKQKLGKNISLDKIIVASDGSTDKTAEIAGSYSQVLVVNGKINRGKAYRENEIISLTTSDVLVLLDADTRIKDRFFLSKLVTPVLTNQADMTSCDIESLHPKKFWETALWVSMEVKRKLFDEFRNGNNIYTCHGTARAFSKELYKNIDFAKSEGEDMYSYFCALKMGKRFLFIKRAKIIYKLPDNIKDHMKQSLRYSSSIKHYKDIFGEEFIDCQFRIPAKVLVRAGFKSLPVLVKNPVHFISYLIVYFYSKLISRLYFDPTKTWEVSSSKIIN